MTVVIVWCTVLVFVAVYLAPTLMALLDDGTPVLSLRNRSILFVNVLLGWTVVGWFAAVIMLARWRE